MKQSEEETLETLQKEIEKLQQRQAELRFQKDNLEYAKAHREVLDWEKKLAEEKKKHTTLEESVQEKQAQKDKLAFQLLLKEWYENEQSIRSLSQQIATLEQNSGLEETNQRMEEIKEEAKALWGKADQSIGEMVKQYFGYQKFLKRKGLELSQADKQKTKDIAKLTSEIDFLYTQMNDFEFKGR